MKRLAALHEFCKIYSHRHERFSDEFTEYWPLHLRQFNAACDDYDVLSDDRSYFLLLSLCGGAVHFFM